MGTMEKPRIAILDREKQASSYVVPKSNTESPTNPITNSSQYRKTNIDREPKINVKNPFNFHHFESKAPTCPLGISIFCCSFCQ
ncbi:unnamed protein product [Fasciola hepatica]|uniref:Uncharacterized protein n=1 Tax=Fasciola hepatica TaxID=6192 RepID=A0ABC9HIY7_FASHE